MLQYFLYHTFSITPGSSIAAMIYREAFRIAATFIAYRTSQCVLKRRAVSLLREENMREGLQHARTLKTSPNFFVFGKKRTEQLGLE
jgi:hypothetical protein